MNDSHLDIDEIFQSALGLSSLALNCHRLNRPSACRPAGRCKRSRC